jgi:hypothetical protein
MTRNIDTNYFKEYGKHKPTLEDFVTNTKIWTTDINQFPAAKILNYAQATRAMQKHSPLNSRHAQLFSDAEKKLAEVGYFVKSTLLKEQKTLVSRLIEGWNTWEDDRAGEIFSECGKYRALVQISEAKPDFFSDLGKLAILSDQKIVDTMRKKYASCTTVAQLKNFQNEFDKLFENVKGIRKGLRSRYGGLFGKHEYKLIEANPIGLIHGLHTELSIILEEPQKYLHLQKALNKKIRNVQNCVAKLNKPQISQNYVDLLKQNFSEINQREGSFFLDECVDKYNGLVNEFNEVQLINKTKFADLIDERMKLIDNNLSEFKNVKSWGKYKKELQVLSQYCTQLSISNSKIKETQDLLIYVKGGEPATGAVKPHAEFSPTAGSLPILNSFLDVVRLARCYVTSEENGSLQRFFNIIGKKDKSTARGTFEDRVKVALKVDVVYDNQTDKALYNYVKGKCMEYSI